MFTCLFCQTLSKQTEWMSEERVVLIQIDYSLFVYHIDKDEWRSITSPNSPLPRSGHAWCHGGNSGGIYLFGGRSWAVLQ